MNFMWINATSTSQTFIFPAKDESELKNEYLAKVESWATANPNADIYVWFDHHLVSPSAIDATRAVLDAYDQTISSRIQFKTIQDASLVKQYPDIFSDAINVWLKIDLFKNLIPLHFIETAPEQYDYSIFSDLDIGILKEEELFTEKNIEFLNDVGMLMGDDHETSGGPGYENGFMVVNLKDRDISSILERYMGYGALNWISKSINAKAYDHLPIDGGRIFGLYSRLADQVFLKKGYFKSCGTNEGTNPLSQKLTQELSRRLSESDGKLSEVDLISRIDEAIQYHYTLPPFAPDALLSFMSCQVSEVGKSLKERALTTVKNRWSNKDSVLPVIGIKTRPAKGRYGNNIFNNAAPDAEHRIRNMTIALP